MKAPSNYYSKRIHTFPTENTSVRDILVNTVEYVLGNMCVCIVVGSIVLVGLSFVSFQFYHIPFLRYIDSPLVYTTFLGWSLYALFKRGREYLVSMLDTGTNIMRRQTNLNLTVTL